jgi:hypothetical protein
VTSASVIVDMPLPAVAYGSTQISEIRGSRQDNADHCKCSFLSSDCTRITEGPVAPELDVGKTGNTMGPVA